MHDRTLIHKGCSMREGNYQLAGYPPKTHQRLQKNRIRRETLSPVTSYREGRTVFTTCVSWTLTPSLTGTSHRRSVFRRYRIRRIRSICSPASRNFVTSSPSLCCLMPPLVGKAKATREHISRCLAKKWKHPYLRTCSYVKSRVVITLVCANHRFIRGSRLPLHNISVQQLQWEDGAGLHLFFYRNNGKWKFNWKVYFMHSKT